jgi:hypothetical protein
MSEIKVTNEFINIYRNFNVKDVSNEIKTLSQKELYLLLTLCLDKHSDDNSTVLHNFQSFREQVMEIYDIQDDKETTNPLLKVLIEESGDKYIETDDIVDENGNKLPDPYTKGELRDIKINLIND